MPVPEWDALPGWRNLVTFPKQPDEVYFNIVDEYIERITTKEGSSKDEIP